MALLLFIGGIVVLATFVAVLMMDPTDPFEPTAPQVSAPRPVPAAQVAPALEQKRSDPAFYEQIGRRTVVLPEIEQSPARSPYVVDLSGKDARKK